MSKDLAPPVVMRHLERTRDPLPAIGSTPNRSGGNSPPHSGSDASSPPHSGSDASSPPKAHLDGTPTTMVGSLALARRRNRGTSSSPNDTRSPSPEESGQAPVPEERTAHHLHHHHRPAALNDLLDPQPQAHHAPPLMAHRPDGPQQSGGTSPVARHYGRLEPLDVSTLSPPAGQLAVAKKQGVSPPRSEL